MPRRRLWSAMASAAFVVALAGTPNAAAQDFGVVGGRIDFGDMAREDTKAGTFEVRAGTTSAVNVLVTIENDPDGALTVSPATATVPAGGTLSVALTLLVPAEAVPGRHQPSVVVSQATTGSGNVAGGAVRVPVTYVVGAVDVAAAQITADGKMQLRIVNGHAAGRTIDVTVADPSGALGHAAGPTTVAAGSSWLVEWLPAWASVANGTHTLQTSGTSVGGTTETFAATVTVTVAGNERSASLSPGAAAITSGGGGGGGGRGTAAAVADPLDGPAGAAPDATGGAPAAGSPSRWPDQAFDLVGDTGGARADSFQPGQAEPPGAPGNDGPAPPASWVVSAVLALAASAAVASGLRRGFKNE